MNPLTQPPPSPARSSKSEVTLIPWDPESPDHIQRMTQQRKACGWKQEKVQSWRELQRAGTTSLQWVVLSDSDPNQASKLKRHIKAYPSEKSPLIDSASSFGGKSRFANLEKSFIPIGHISLNDRYETPETIETPEGMYWISHFYISKALQGDGLGRAAMDIVECMAIAEPLNARVLALSTARNEQDDLEERRRALGYPVPKTSVQDWYARRGFEAFESKRDMWFDRDSTGKVWGFEAVFMRKYIE